MMVGHATLIKSHIGKRRLQCPTPRNLREGKRPNGVSRRHSPMANERMTTLEGWRSHQLVLVFELDKHKYYWISSNFTGGKGRNSNSDQVLFLVCREFHKMSAPSSTPGTSILRGIRRDRRPSMNTMLKNAHDQ